jgi:hypothetical protein
VRPRVFLKALKKEEGMSYHHQNHLTVVLGHPRENDKSLNLELDELAIKSNKTLEDAWIYYAACMVDMSVTPENSKDASPLEVLFSAFFGQEIIVHKPFLGCTFRGIKALPVAIFYEGSIQDLSGNLIPISRFTKDMREAIGTLFYRVIKPEWVHISSTVELS